MSTALAVLRHFSFSFSIFFFKIPMSTALAVLRREFVGDFADSPCDSYVYCVSGTETFSVI